MAGAEPGPGAQKGQAAVNIQQVALELAKAFRALELYPIGHPQLKTIFHASFQKIFYEMSRVSEVVLTVGKDGLSFQGKLLDNAVEALQEFALELHIRQVRKFGFRSNLDERDFMDFLRMLLIPAGQFRTGKKIEEYFRTKKISTIWVNEVDFQKVFLGKKFADAAEQELADQESQDFYQARLLVESLDLAADDGQAQEVLSKIAGEQTRLASEQKHPELWFLTGAVSDFFDLKKDKCPGACASAEQLLKSAARPQFMSWLVERYNYSDESSGKAFERYFDQVGEPSLQAVVERVLKPESVFFQKQLLNYLKGKGDQARPVIEAKLNGQKGQQARKLIYLLGELKNPESAPLLLEFAGSREKLLKLEAIRALGKLKSKNVSLALVGMLRKKDLDAEGKSVLIQTFGERQEPAAVPGLMAILKDRNEDDDLRERAAEALGKIGSQEALPPLMEIAEKPGLFRKAAPEKLRLKAAEALARLGGERVDFLLSKLARGDDRLAEFCRELIAHKPARKGN